MDVGEADLAALDDEIARSGHVLNGGLDVEDGEDALRCGHAFLQAGVEPGEAFERLIGQQQRGDEGEEGARRAGARQHLVAAIENDQRHRDTAQRFHQRRGDGAGARSTLQQPGEIVDHPARAVGLIGFHAIGLDVARALEALIEQRHQQTDLGLRVGRDAPHPLAELDDRAEGQRERYRGDQRQRPVLVEHQRDQESGGERFLADIGEQVGGGAAQHRGVHGEARHQRAGRIGVEEGDVGAHQPREERRLNIGDYTEADLRHQHRLAVIGDALEEGEGHDRRRNDQQQPLVMRDENPIEHRLHQPGISGGGGRHHAHAGEREPQCGQMGAQEDTEQPPQ